MHALQRQLLNFGPKHNASCFRRCVYNGHACQQLGLYSAVEASIASSKFGNSPGSSGSSSNSSSSSSSEDIVVLDASDKQTLLEFFRAPKPASAVLSVLKKVAGPGVLKELHGRALLGGDVLQPGDYLYQRQAAAQSTSGTVPTFYKDITVTVVGTEPRLFHSASRRTLQKLLDSHNCYTVQHPISKLWVDFDELELQDDMALLALPCSISFDSRLSTLENFI